MIGFIPKSIRIQLLIISLTIAVPAVCIIIYSGYQFRKAAIEDAWRETQKFADRIAAEQQNLVVSAEQMMAALAQLPEVKKRDKAKTESMLRALRSMNYMYSNIMVADRSGDIWASAVPPIKLPVTVADRRYFQNAVTSGRLSSGEYVVSRITAKPVLSLGYPVKGDHDVVTDVIIIGLEIQ